MGINSDLLIFLTLAILCEEKVSVCYFTTAFIYEPHIHLLLLSLAVLKHIVRCGDRENHFTEGGGIYTCVLPMYGVHL